jgi:very-short-patch-repair endonuclease
VAEGRMRGVLPLELSQSLIDDRPMRGSEPKVRRRAQSLRRTSTDAEIVLWSALRNRSLRDFKFVRQAPVGRYFADFLCREQKLIVEVDGSQHEGNTYDAARDGWLLQEGYSVLRLWNGHVLREKASALETILLALQGELDEHRSGDFKFMRPDRRK